jgi:hypothetical protein
VGKRGRPGPTLDDYLYWQERLANRQASDLSIDDFCIAEVVSRSTFYHWAQRLREGVPDSVREEGAIPTLAELAEPVLDRIAARLAELENRALPKSALGKAVGYALNQWRALRRYTEDGRLSIDNIVSERTLRHQAIGRKNWLFLGSEQAGPRAAVLFTILAGAKRHRIEPWTYLRELLLRLHNEDPRLDEMLPDHWAAQHPEAVLTCRLEEARRKAARQSSRRRHAQTRHLPR